MLRLRFRIDPPKPLDSELAELIDAIWAAERMWRLEDRIEAGIRYGREPRLKRISQIGSIADG